jgi:hypothetical protein
MTGPLGDVDNGSTVFPSNHAHAHARITSAALADLDGDARRGGKRADSRQKVCIARLHIMSNGSTAYSMTSDI